MPHSATSGDPVRNPGVPSAGDTSGPEPETEPKVRLLLFAAAREAAGTREQPMSGRTVEELLARARRRFGEPFAVVLARSRVWVNGEPADPTDALSDGDEVAVLPPVSGG
jgi:molybdopterin synthase sulfur carrier subunit